MLFTLLYQKNWQNSCTWATDQCVEWLTSVQNLCLAIKYMFSTTSCFFFFCQETIYWKVAFVFPFHALKQSSRAFNHSFISIAFAQYRVIMWWKNNEGSPWIRASGRSRKKRSNFAGFSGTNSRKKRPISREFRGNFSGQFRWKTIGKERPIS